MDAGKLLKTWASGAVPYGENPDAKKRKSSKASSSPLEYDAKAKALVLAAIRAKTTRSNPLAPLPEVRAELARTAGWSRAEADAMLKASERAYDIDLKTANDHSKPGVREGAIAEKDTTLSSSGNRTRYKFYAVIR